MSTIDFSSGTVVPKEWLNDADYLIYNIFNGLSAVPSVGKIFQSNGTHVVASAFTLPTTIGAAGTLLRSDGTNFATWGSTIPDTFAQYDLIYASAANTLTALAKTNSSVLVTNGSGVPAWSSSSATFPYTLAVAQGGTGAATLGTSQLLIGAGTSAVAGLGSLGTTTTVLHGNAAGAPSFAAVTANDFGTQTANTFLAGPTSAGPSTPTFRTVVAADVPASVGTSMVLLATGTASNSSEIDFTQISSTYDVYMVECVGILPATNAVALQLRFSIDGGSTYKAGGTDYVYANNALTTGTVDASIASGGATAILLNGAAGISNTTVTGGYTGQVILLNMNSTTKGKVATYSGMAGRAESISGSGASALAAMDTGAINAIRFLMSSGNITSGVFYLYGIKKS